MVMYNIDCQVKCGNVTPRQMYCNVARHHTPNHTYCTTTINNRQYKYLHTCENAKDTPLHICEIHPDKTHNIIDPRKVDKMCFKCNTSYFAFLYKYYNGII